MQSTVRMKDRKWERKLGCMDASLHGYTKTSQHVEAEIWQDLRRRLKCLDFPVSKCVDPQQREGQPCVMYTEFPPLLKWSRWRQTCPINYQHSGRKSKRMDFPKEQRPPNVTGVEAFYVLCAITLRVSFKLSRLPQK